MYLVILLFCIRGYFKVFLQIMIFLIEQVLPSGYFDQSLRALSVDMAVLRDLLHQRLPKLATHLDSLQKNSGKCNAGFRIHCLKY